MSDELAELRQQLAEHKELTQAMRDGFIERLENETSQLRQQLAEAQAQVAAMRAALAYYANPKWYKLVRVPVYECGGGAVIGDDEMIDVLRDHGQRAREALGGEQ